MCACVCVCVCVCACTYKVISKKDRPVPVARHNVIGTYCSQCAVVHCTVLQYHAVCCSVLQCVAAL